MYKCMMGLMLLVSISIRLMAAAPEPYASIEVLPFDGHGWFVNSDTLKVQLEIHKPKIVIEMGSWLGLSTRFIASNTDSDTKVYAVDTWRGSSKQNTQLSDRRLPYLYQQFLSNVIHAGMTNKIIPIRMNSLEAAKALNIKADLIYIDGAHDTKSVTEDILAWSAHLVEGGCMCGDDWKWMTVSIAVTNCAKELNKKVCFSENFWWYE